MTKYMCTGCEAEVKEINWKYIDQKYYCGICDTKYTENESDRNDIMNKNDNLHYTYLTEGCSMEENNKVKGLEEEYHKQDGKAYKLHGAEKVKVTNDEVIRKTLFYLSERVLFAMADDPVIEAQCCYMTLKKNNARKRIVLLGANKFTKLHTRVQNNRAKIFNLRTKQNQGYTDKAKQNMASVRGVYRAGDGRRGRQVDHYNAYVEHANKYGIAYTEYRKLVSMITEASEDHHKIKELHIGARKAVTSGLYVLNRTNKTVPKAKCACHAERYIFQMIETLRKAGYTGTAYVQGVRRPCLVCYTAFKHIDNGDEDGIEIKLTGSNGREVSPGIISRSTINQCNKSHLEFIKSDETFGKQAKTCSPSNDGYESHTHYATSSEEELTYKTDEDGDE